jgi:trans-L-3-hydroxyproline dehydratase
MQFNTNNFSNYQSITTIDAHTEGEPLRIITDGYPEIKGDTILEKRQYLLNNLDHLRQLLMFEPRGHADMYGALITEPCTVQAKFGILFMHNEGYSSMCGHGIIAAVSVAIESGALPMPEKDEVIGIDAPAGFIQAYAQHDQDNNLAVSFDNVPSFVEALNQQVDVEGYGTVNYDIAYGGAYYAYVDADALNIDCSPDNQQQLIDAGRAIKHAVMANYVLKHPVEADLSFLYGTIFYSAKTDVSSSHSRHVCVFADGEVDRSPTGTGVSARAALLKAKELLPLNEEVVIESIVGGKMTVTIQSCCDYYGKAAVIPRVSGRAYVTGCHTFMLNTDDIFPHGFILR